jgi:hypothetical protein
MALVWLSLAQPVGLESVVPWEKVSDSDGLLLERRSVATSASPEYRITAKTTVPVDTLCERIFEWGTRGTDVPGLKSRKELSAAPNERVVYDQFEAPVVSNRDYAITVKRARGADGVCRIRYWATNEKAPPKLDGWVRLEQLWGGWTFIPREGHTELVYTQFSDPGGSLPAVFANGSQRDRALQSVRMAIEKGKAERK